MSFFCLLGKHLCILQTISGYGSKAHQPTQTIKKIREHLPGSTELGLMEGTVEQAVQFRHKGYITMF